MPISTAITILIVFALFGIYFGGDKTKELRSGVNVFLITILLGLGGLFCYNKINETINEPDYEIPKYFSKWDWETDQTSFIIDKDNFNLKLYSGQINDLPNSNTLNNLIENSITKTKSKTTGFKLNKINITIDYEQQFPKMIKTLYINLNYESAEGRTDWDWNGDKYVEKKVKGTIDTTYRYNLETLKEF
jgi:hypothetical protein